MSKYIKLPEHVFLDYIQSALAAADVADERRACDRELARNELQLELLEINTSVMPVTIEKRNELLERVKILKELSGCKR